MPLLLWQHFGIVATNEDNVAQLRVYYTHRTETRDIVSGCIHRVSLTMRSLSLYWYTAYHCQARCICIQMLCCPVTQPTILIQAAMQLTTFIPQLNWADLLK